MSASLARWVGYSAEELSASARYFPWVGALLGVVASALWIATNSLWSVWIAALLTTAFSAWITGAFHEDGLADTADALGGTVTRERALAIMKDSRIGTYGTVALFFGLALRVAALAAIGQTSGVVVAAVALIFAHTNGRAGACVVLATLTYVRSGGDGNSDGNGDAKSKPLAQSMRAVELAIALCAPLIVALTAIAVVKPSLSIAWPLLVSTLVCALIIVLWRRMLQRRLGGFTGDTLGAVEQLIEAATLLTFAANVAANFA